jgi:hypothetical protein
MPEPTRDSRIFLQEGLLDTTGDTAPACLHRLTRVTLQQSTSNTDTSVGALAKRATYTTLFRGARVWRINPPTDDGTMHVLEDPLAAGFPECRAESVGGLVSSMLDMSTERETSVVVTTSRLSRRPRLRVESNTVARSSTSANTIAFRPSAAERAGGDRRVAHGDRLPLERRVSVGGPGTIPGFDFRRVEMAPMSDSAAKALRSCRASRSLRSRCARAAGVSA